MNHQLEPKITMVAEFGQQLSQLNLANNRSGVSRDMTVIATMRSV
jgi:hypothetical protein